MEKGEDESPRLILNCVFWAFNPCIEDFKYCKPLVQVDGTFLTGKYRGTLLTAIGQEIVGIIFHLLLRLLRARLEKLECGSCIICGDMLHCNQICVLYQTGEPVC